MLRAKYDRVHNLYSALDLFHDGVDLRSLIPRPGIIITIVTVTNDIALPIAIAITVTPCVAMQLPSFTLVLASTLLLLLQPQPLSAMVFGFPLFGLQMPAIRQQLPSPQPPVNPQPVKFTCPEQNYQILEKDRVVGVRILSNSEIKFRTNEAPGKYELKARKLCKQAITCFRENILVSVSPSLQEQLEIAFSSCVKASNQFNGGLFAGQLLRSFLKQPDQPLGLLVDTKILDDIA